MGRSPSPRPRAIGPPGITHRYDVQMRAARSKRGSVTEAAVPSTTATDVVKAVGHGPRRSPCQHDEPNGRGFPPRTAHRPHRSQVLQGGQLRVPVFRTRLPLRVRWPKEALP